MSMRTPAAVRAVRLLLAAGASAAAATGLLLAPAPAASAIPPADFLASYADDAQAGEREHGVPTSVALAQAALESGWGESSLTRDGNAFFGIKCGSDNGPYATGCVTKETTECDATGCHPVTAQFRAYASHADSFRDHGDFLRSRAHYAPAFAFTDDPDQFVREIHAAGYATDPDYPDKIIGLMQRYDMYRYDLGGGDGTPARPTISEGDQGAAVSEAQTLLNAAGGYGLVVDGIFGPATAAAVRDLQTRHGLQVDGIIGPNTWSVLAG
ncbi:glucosaminidase domain-containing protein [Desertihabitans aurantiacus]|uniref:glucosaminidase domain-containing protein n=1 Tax=Desertihabitans aurantiacus TaxID=2282477 RepID=UPI000DF7C2E9|nr:glucosaminidase domain-containing protein [Desertihabitans aurantiacus]